MRRLYFLLPDIEVTTRIVNALQAMGIDESYLHVIAKDHHLLERAHLHEATEVETTHLEKDLDFGLAAGGVAGLVAGLTAVAFPPAGLALGGGTILAMSALGAGFGGWWGSLIGKSTPDEVVKKYEQAVAKGQLLLMVDVLPDKVAEVVALVKHHHPQATIETTYIAHDHETA